MERSRDGPRSELSGDLRRDGITGRKRGLAAATATHGDEKHDERGTKSRRHGRTPCQRHIKKVTEEV
jgi:hypothetical protein